ncbi:hypothetical protein [Acidiphilium angustum]|uniref:hypothetical protein n=1 Tax=Acidiphilium angustum TaxID=523 RepID=UPI0004943B46|nr:hypothetical protein [Acidiphilium angustum]
MKNLLRAALVIMACSGTARAQSLVSDYVNQLVPTISTLAQAQYYAAQMQTICLGGKKTGECKCVSDAVLHDAITGQFSENYRIVLLAQATKDDEKILKGPQDQIGRSVSIDFATLQYLSQDLVEKSYSNECKKMTKNGK